MIRSRDYADRPVYVIRLRPNEGVDPIRALRRALKYLLRACGLRAISVERAEAANQARNAHLKSGGAR